MLSYAQQAVLEVPVAGSAHRRRRRRSKRCCGAAWTPRRRRASSRPGSTRCATWRSRRRRWRWLERVWEKTRQRCPGLTLAEPDFITLALELAVRAGPAWEQILEGQQARIQNPDRKAQFEFVQAGALRRRRHPRRVLREPARREEPRPRDVGAPGPRLPAPSAARRVRGEAHRPSLELLREIQRTGDIFFPKRWMDATLSGHQSASAALMVSEFLKRVPKDYPERLRRIILSSADDLIARAPHPGTVNGGVLRTDASLSARRRHARTRLRALRRRTNRMPTTPTRSTATAANILRTSGRLFSRKPRYLAQATVGHRMQSACFEHVTAELEGRSQFRRPCRGHDSVNSAFRFGYAHTFRGV